MLIQKARYQVAETASVTCLVCLKCFKSLSSVSSFRTYLCSFNFDPPRSLFQASKSAWWVKCVNLLGVCWCLVDGVVKTSLSRVHCLLNGLILALGVRPHFNLSAPLTPRSVANPDCPPILSYPRREHVKRKTLKHRALRSAPEISFI